MSKTSRSTPLITGVLRLVEDDTVAIQFMEAETTGANPEAEMRLPSGGE